VPTHRQFTLLVPAAASRNVSSRGSGTVGRLQRQVHSLPRAWSTSVSCGRSVFPHHCRYRGWHADSTSALL